MSLIANNGLVCVGGPYHQQRILLECPNSGTLTFNANGMHGRYVYKSSPINGGYLKWENH
ncbi:hypothetical protein [Vibrio phage vB_VpS_CA8]|nr:hypothetical protein VspDsh1_21 [Vibrio phage VspDsh_1]QEA10959.1 hypothetical protein [Vibrio phage vB_VpS_CA8]QEQ95095.1 hypothetical protein [Vibrio phage vB_VpS_BA3]UFK26951.1 hypothetical protein [Vibrio phage vB_VpaS_AL-2]